MKKAILSVAGLLVAGFFYYCIVGTNGNIEEITLRAPLEIPARGWQILRYEGYQYGSFGKHGGRAWYHVRNTSDHSIQYRVQVTLWDGRLEYWYKAPEILIRADLKGLTKNLPN